MTTAASTCNRCRREGFISSDQQSHTVGGGYRLSKTIRFACICGHEWTSDAAECEAQGRFLDKAGLR